jgi:hypothetical protein
MVLTSDCIAITTHKRLEEANTTLNQNAIHIERKTNPLDPDTDPVLICERLIPREAV